MEQNRESQNRRDQDGRRLRLNRRQELVVVATDRREDLDRRAPYIRRASFDRRGTNPIMN